MTDADSAFIEAKKKIQHPSMGFDQGLSRMMEPIIRETLINEIEKNYDLPDVTPKESSDTTTNFYGTVSDYRALLQHTIEENSKGIKYSEALRRLENTFNKIFSYSLEQVFDDMMEDIEIVNQERRRNPIELIKLATLKKNVFGEFRDRDNFSFSEIENIIKSFLANEFNPIVDKIDYPIDFKETLKGNMKKRINDQLKLLTGQLHYFFDLGATIENPSPDELIELIYTESIDLNQKTEVKVYQPTNQEIIPIIIQEPTIEVVTIEAVEEDNKVITPAIKDSEPTQDIGDKNLTTEAVQIEVDIIDQSIKKPAQPTPDKEKSKEKQMEAVKSYVNRYLKDCFNTLLNSHEIEAYFDGLASVQDLQDLVNLYQRLENTLIETLDKTTTTESLSEEITDSIRQAISSINFSSLDSSLMRDLSKKYILGSFISDLSSKKPAHSIIRLDEPDNYIVSFDLLREKLLPMQSSFLRAAQSDRHQVNNPKEAEITFLKNHSNIKATDLALQINVDFHGGMEVRNAKWIENQLKLLNLASAVALKKEQGAQKTADQLKAIPLEKLPTSAQLSTENQKLILEPITQKLATIESGLSSLSARLSSFQTQPEKPIDYQPQFERLQREIQVLHSKANQTGAFDELKNQINAMNDELKRMKTELKPAKPEAIMTTIAAPSIDMTDLASQLFEQLKGHIPAMIDNPTPSKTLEVYGHGFITHMREQIAYRIDQQWELINKVMNDKNQEELIKMEENINRLIAKSKKLFKEIQEANALMGNKLEQIQISADIRRIESGESISEEDRKNLLHTANILNTLIENSGTIDDIINNFNIYNKLIKDAHRPLDQAYRYLNETIYSQCFGVERSDLAEFLNADYDSKLNLSEVEAYQGRLHYLASEISKILSEKPNESSPETIALAERMVMSIGDALQSNLDDHEGELINLENLPEVAQKLFLEACWARLGGKERAWRVSPGSDLDDIVQILKESAESSQSIVFPMADHNWINLLEPITINKLDSSARGAKFHPTKDLIAIQKNNPNKKLIAWLYDKGDGNGERILWTLLPSSIEEMQDTDYDWALETHLNSSFEIATSKK